VLHHIPRIEHRISLFNMQFTLLCLMASTAAGMVADMAAIDRAKHNYTMQVGSAGDVVEPPSPIRGKPELPTQPVNWSCIPCCYDEHYKTQILFKSEFDAAMRTMDYTGYGTFNTERRTAFSNCRAVTTQQLLYVNDIDVFLAWGGLVAQMKPFPFCHKACQPPTTSHPARVLFQGLIAQVATSYYEAEQKVVANNNHITNSQTPEQIIKAAMQFHSTSGSCRTGCFSGKKEMVVAGASGTFCADTSKASLNICKAKYFAAGYAGTCTGMSVSPGNKTEHPVAGSAKLIGGSGTCVARDTINKIVCEPGNAWVAYLHSGMTVEAKIGSTCLLEEFAQNLEMTIDETLDHSEHGPHAEDLLVDCYRHALNEGVSLVERSRRDASHFKHQLKDSHLKRAMALHARLSEENQKHKVLPDGFVLEF